MSLKKGQEHIFAWGEAINFGAIASGENEKVLKTI